MLIILQFRTYFLFFSLFKKLEPNKLSEHVDSFHKLNLVVINLDLTLKFNFIIHFRFNIYFSNDGAKWSWALQAPHMLSEFYQTWWKPESWISEFCFDGLVSLITISSLHSVCLPTLRSRYGGKKIFFWRILNISEVTVVIGNLRGERNY